VPGDPTAVNYDRLSRLYDLLSGGFENRFRDLALRRLDARPGESVLEVGFGTGSTLVKLAGAVGPAGAVHGVDLSPGMLAVAQRRLRRAACEDRVRLLPGDARSLPCPDAAFDALFMSFTLELFEPADASRVLSECRRVLRPGGRICVVSLSSEGPASLTLRLYRWAHRRFSRFVDCRPIAAARALAEAGLHVADATVAGSWGLAVETVLAGRP